MTHLVLAPFIKPPNILRRAYILSSVSLQATYLASVCCNTIIVSPPSSSQPHRTALHVPTYFWQRKTNGLLPSGHIWKIYQDLFHCRIPRLVDILIGELRGFPRKLKYVQKVRSCFLIISAIYNRKAPLHKSIGMAFSG